MVPGERVKLKIAYVGLAFTFHGVGQHVTLTGRIISDGETFIVLSNASRRNTWGKNIYVSEFVGLRESSGEIAVWDLPYFEAKPA